jgi:nucleotide-binding universal stress UspA family protein
MMSTFPTRILFATDGSEDAALAGRAAADLSNKVGSELYVVHVLPRFPRHAYPGITSELYSYVLDETYEEARRLLNEEAKRVEDGGGRIAESHIRRGQFVDEILDLAQEIEVGLILMGGRGLGPVKRLLLGSVAEGVVHDAHCPVLVLRGGSHAWPPERIVVGDDGSEEAKGAEELAASIGGLYGAKGLLVRAYPKLPEMDAEGRRSNARMVEDELRREQRALTDRARELEGAFGLHSRVEIAAGDPAVSLLRAAEEGAAEKALIGVGSRGLGAVRRMRLGSVSTKVLHVARGAVLVYPRSEG